jgi:hypothetical protein
MVAVVAAELDFVRSACKAIVSPVKTNRARCFPCMGPEKRVCRVLAGTSTALECGRVMAG